MTVRTVGPSRLTTKDNTGKFLRRLQVAQREATKAMAREVRDQAQQIFRGDGDGRWAPNQPSTVEWKGHDKVMEGRTATLSDGIQIRDSGTGTKAVGWFVEPHPDSDYTQAALAWLHEQDRPWMSQVHDNPVRAEAVVKAGKDAYRRAML